MPGPIFPVVELCLQRAQGYLLVVCEVSLHFLHGSVPWGREEDGSSVESREFVQHALQSFPTRACLLEHAF